MCILSSVAKKDKEWRRIAYNISKSKSKADDLVQDMYLRLHKYNVDRWNYSFITLLLWNLFKDNCKEKKELPLETDNYIVTNEEKKSYNDRDLFILKEINKLSEDEKKILEMNFDLSVGKIAEGLSQCRIKTYRELIDIRKKVLGNNFDKEYKNRRLKYKK